MLTWLLCLPAVFWRFLRALGRWIAGLSLTLMALGPVYSYSLGRMGKALNTSLGAILDALPVPSTPGGYALCAAVSVLGLSMAWAARKIERG